MDFAQREGILLLIGVGGFLVAANYNKYLDRLEAQEYKRKIRIEEDDDESEEETISVNQPVYYPLNKPLDEYDWI